ncbi:hypothetical protein BC831DRAFT_485576 [Entophlyctis helioformis]|nr:hypothetical protein BC831DRAFT_485576 [Entophlyctis helioformis]
MLSVAAVVAFLVNPIALSVAGFLYVVAAWSLSGRFQPARLRKHLSGRHVLVTGASKGLGKAIAAKLVQAGARVTLVARGKDIDPATQRSSLDDAVLELRELGASVALPGTTQVNGYAVDLTDYAQVVAFVRRLRGEVGLPDWIVASAGAAKPGYLADQLPAPVSDSASASSSGGASSPASASASALATAFKAAAAPHETMMQTNYLSAVNITRALVQVAKETAKDDNEDAAFSIAGRIIFVGSMLSLMSFVGYSAYSASKFALRGLADGLRSEFLPLGVKVHAYFPGNIDSPGFAEENKTKPAVTVAIEGQDVPASARSVAQFLLAGVLNERFYITNDFLGELARVSVQGAGPRPNLIPEILMLPLTGLIFSVWSMYADYTIGRHFASKAASI